MHHYRKPEKGGGLFSAIEHQRVVAGKNCGILKLRDLIPWEAFRALLEEIIGYAGRDWRKGGKPPFDPVAARNLLSCPPHRGRSEWGSVPGSEGVWGERGAGKG